MHRLAGPEPWRAGYKLKFLCADRFRQVTAGWKLLHSVDAAIVVIGCCLRGGRLRREACLVELREQVADGAVTVRTDSDPLPPFEERLDHARAHVGLAAPRRTLNRLHFAREIQGDAL